MSRIQMVLSGAGLTMALVVANVIVSHAARAETGRQAVCTSKFEKQKGEDADTAVAQWLNSQLAAGRVNAMVLPTDSLTHMANSVTVCAW